MTARKLALNVLLRCERGGGYSTLTLDSALKGAELSDSDRALATCLVFGVISRKITLDYYISELSSLPDRKIEPETRNIIRLGLYQLIYLDRIPAHAAVNESVALAPRRSVGFVNALLRSYLRKKDEIKLPSDPIAAMSVSKSFPEALCEKIVAEYGYSRAESVFEAMNITPALTLRVNTLKTDRDCLIQSFISAGIDAEPGKLSPFAIKINGTPVTKLPGFDEGLFFVQDEASQLCTAAVGAKPGNFFIDTCAAPGSKSFGVAMTMENCGKIMSFDLHENKVSLIRSGATNLGINIINAQSADARSFVAELEEQADCVLCDVPCSGFGVIAKKPEIRFKSLEDAANLPDIQYSIIDNCSRYVKPGGVLVYSTCTVLSAENADNVARFLSDHKEFSLENFNVNGKEYPAELQLLPDTDGCDGFYIAKFRKNV